ncbi:MAG: V4R domain-containing protein [Candidatus Bathyarchaeia archaeon]
MGSRIINLTRKSISNFLRGHIAGWFSELVESRVEVVEEYCEAKGDPSCYFVVRPPIP